VALLGNGQYVKGYQQLDEALTLGATIVGVGACLQDPDAKATADEGRKEGRQFCTTADFLALTQHVLDHSQEK
jgi:hypothetical protein